MSYWYKKIPVLFAVLVFVLLSAGCGGRKAVLELSPQETGVNDNSAGSPEGYGIREESPETDSSERINAPGQEDVAPGASPEAEEEALLECVVHICGAVNHPGVYRFPAGSRICDAVSRAGGLCEEAAERCVNQAALLTDGMQIVIPTLEEAETMQVGWMDDVTGAAGPQPEEEGGPVNINSASASELMTLPGIGQTKAQTILSYREKNGPFGKIEDIMKVDGIGEGSFQKLKSRITVR